MRSLVISNTLADNEQIQLIIIKQLSTW